MPRSPRTGSTPTAESAAFAPAALERELARLVPGWPRASLLVAFSGGADSLALLAALAQIRRGLRLDPRRGLRLRALHVDHGLNPAARHWARAAAAAARRLRVAFVLRRTRVVALPGESLEACARLARYGLLAAALRPGELLVTAHHEDDQAETLLLQLLRGAGIAGLAAMPQSAPFAGTRLLRPLLGFPRAALGQWLGQERLQWIEDESNADQRFDRNFLRRQVLPALVSRWPQAPRVIARAAAHFGATRALLAEYADLDLIALERCGALGIEGLRRLSPPRQHNLVRRWLERAGLPLPDRRRLERIVGEACEARADALPVIDWSGAQVRRWRGYLYAMRPPGPPPAPLLWRHRRAAQLTLPAGLGRLRLVADPQGPLLRSRLPALLRVSFRAGGERLRTATGGPRRRLKSLLREAGVLPWMRECLPLVHAGDALLAVADLCCNADSPASAATRAKPAARAGRSGIAADRVRLEWSDHPPVKSAQAMGAE